MSKQKKGKSPPTTKPGLSRETGQPREEAVSTVKVNQKLIPKINRIGADEKKKIFSIIARITTRRMTEEEAQAEIKTMLRNVKPANVYAVAQEIIDFTARITLAARRVAATLTPAARNQLTEKN